MIFKTHLFQLIFQHMDVHRVDEVIQSIVSSWAGAKVMANSWSKGLVSASKRVGITCRIQLLIAITDEIILLYYWLRRLLRLVD